MAVLEDTNVSTPSVYRETYKSFRGGSETKRNVTGLVPKGITRKVEGTGRRKFPSPMHPTPYYLRHVVTNPVKGVCTAVEKGFGVYTRRGSSLPVAFQDFRITSADGVNKVTVDYVSQAEVQALVSLKTRGRELEGTWNAGVAWGERRETANLLITAAQRVLNIVLMLRSGRWRDANRYLPHGSRRQWEDLRDTPYGRWLREGQRQMPRDVADALASGLLEYQNGWKPLFHDVMNATEALANRNSPADWVITAKGKYERTISGTTEGGADTGYYINPKVLRTHEIFLGCFVRLDATVDNRFFQQLASLGVTNPFSLAWQLTPLSYIADYIVAVGDWLESLDAATGMTFYSGSCSRVYNKRVSIESTGGPGENDFYGSQTHYELDRDVYNNFPIPIAPLSLKPRPLSLSQVSNIAAVLYTLARGLSADFRG